MELRTETIRIEGMSCAHCVRAVREALGRVDGVEVEAVEIGAARVRFDEGQVDREAFARAMEEEGFAVAP